MDIIIQSLGFKASENLENYIREKLDKLDKESKIIRADVAMFMGPPSKHDRYCCEIRLEIPGNDVFVKKCAESFEMAIVDAADTAQMKLRKNKEKWLERVHGGLPAERRQEI